MPVSFLLIKTKHCKLAFGNIQALNSQSYINKIIACSIINRLWTLDFGPLHILISQPRYGPQALNLKSCSKTKKFCCLFVRIFLIFVWQITHNLKCAPKFLRFTTKFANLISCLELVSFLVGEYSMKVNFPFCCFNPTCSLYTPF